MRSRLRELRPAVQEHDRLEAALHALADTGRSNARAAASGSKAHRDSPTKRRRDGAGDARRRRPRASPGANREALLVAARERPGASKAELTKVSGLESGTVSRLLKHLVSKGELQEQQMPSGWMGYAPNDVPDREAAKPARAEPSRPYDPTPGSPAESD
jgi:hypothetical protein